MRDRRAHIKISRRFFEEHAWWTEARRFSKAEAWIDCIQMAAWKPRRFMVGAATEHLNRGEFIASVRFLAHRWGWGKSAVARYFAAAQKAGRLQVQREGQGGTVYLLVNYEAYQGQGAIERDTERDTDEDTRGTPAGHLRDKTEAVKQGKQGKATWLTPFWDAWEAHCGKPPAGKLVGVLGPLVKEHGSEETLLRWSRYLDATDPAYCSPHRFAETWRKWAEPEVQEMTDDYGRMVPHRKNDLGQWVPVVTVA